MTSDMDYYTGIYFEVITPSVGISIGSGGRYDELLGKFGFNVPDVGFSLCLEAVLLTLERQGKKFPKLILPKLIKKENNIKKVFQRMKSLQKKNKSATINL